MAENITTKVEVLIPPPVPPEEAPMNIRKIKMINIGEESKEMSTVLNPAVRVVTD